MITPEEMKAKLIQAMARAIYEDRNGAGCRKFGLIGIAHQKPYLADASAALTAIEAQGLAIVPVEPDDAFWDRVDAHSGRHSRSGETYPVQRNFHRAMIEAGRI